MDVDRIPDSRGIWCLGELVSTRDRCRALTGNFFSLSEKHSLQY
jgi:hypothetical protein